jgi:hypothetical protein
MNGCHFDPTNSYLLYAVGKFILDWFNVKRICQAIFVFLLTLPFLMSIYDEEVMTTELVSRYAYFLLSGTTLLLRISFGMSQYPWMYAAFRQPSPCWCDVVGADGKNHFTYALGSTWSMPSGESLIAALIGLHLAERFSIAIGVLVMVLVPTSCVFVGISSVGQVITGFAIGFILHWYHTRTPLWVRFLDFIFAVISGFLTLPLVKHFYVAENFSTFSMDYFEALIWQVFTFVILTLLFSFGFLRRILVDRVYRLSPIDIQYMNMRLLPAAKINHGEFEGSGDFSDRSRLVIRNSALDQRHEDLADINGHVFSRVVHYKSVMFFIAMLTFAILAALSIASHFIEEILSFGKDVNDPIPFL